MHQIGDIIVITTNNIEELTVKIVKINLDGTFEVMKEDGVLLRIYREYIK